MIINKENIKMERAILVGVDLNDVPDFELYMDEFKLLSQACDMEVVEILTQKLDRADRATFIGPGKLMELKEDVGIQEADIVLFAQSLSPSQLRNVQRELGIPVMDRTSLILEIFSQRARTREAKLQVEVAKLQYTLPRLVGLHDALSRQGGGSGSMSNKGSGEKKLELDRRYLEHRLSELRRELKEVEQNRAIQRKRRGANDIYRVSLVGYTNAGKSTLMNACLEGSLSEREEFLEDKKVFEKDMLFATLDTTVRRIENPGKLPYLLTDTVGFVSNLPHQLVEAFQSTLEEVRESDLLLIVSDFSDINHEEQIDVTRTVLKELGAAEIPCIYVYNKSDLLFKKEELPIIKGNKIYISALNRIGIKELNEMIEQAILGDYFKAELVIPYEEGKIYAYLKENAKIKEEKFTEAGMELKGYVLKKDMDKLLKFLNKTLTI